MSVTVFISRNEHLKMSHLINECNFDWNQQIESSQNRVKNVFNADAVQADLVEVAGNSDLLEELDLWASLVHDSCTVQLQSWPPSLHEK